MLLTPPGSNSLRLSSSVANAGSDGTTVTAAGTTHTMGSWTQLIASTEFAATGVFVMFSTNISSTVDTSMLVDIGIGAASSERVLIPTLMAGGALAWAGDFPLLYYFPIRVPAASRISARAQCATASRTIVAAVWLDGAPMYPGRFVGSRVTAYGINAAASRGTLITPGTSPSWSADVQLSASTAAPIRYLQMGVDMAGDLTGGNRRQITRIGVGSTTSPLASIIPTGEGSGESIQNGAANFLLSRIQFNIPAGSDLEVAMMGNAPEQRSIALYGVD